MHAHTRALIAASAYSVMTGQTVAGIYDYTAARHLRIAAERRGNRLQGADGERSVNFGGTLPELYDDGDKAFVSLEVAGNEARGYDRGSEGHYVAELKGRVVQLFDYDEGSWFAFQVAVAEDSAVGNR